MAPSRHTARDARAPGWFWSDNDLIDHYGPIIGAYGIAVYSALARYADRDGRAFPSYQKLADQLHMSRPTVIKTIGILKDAGLILVNQRTDANGDATSNEYVLVAIATQSHEMALGGKADLPPSKADLPQVVNNVDYGGKGDLPRVVKELYPNKTHVEQDPPPPPKPPAPATRAGGGGGSEQQPTETQRALLAFGFSAPSARRFRDLPLDAVLPELKAAKARGSGAGSLVEAWKVSPPTVPKDRAPSQPVEPTRVERPPDALPPREAARVLNELRQKALEHAHGATTKS